MTHESTLLFSDVDGTLRAHVRSARAPIRLIRAVREVRLILSSSRTLAELLHLQRRWGAPMDMIAEDGAVVATTDRGLAEALGATEVVRGNGASWRILPLADTRDATRVRAEALLTRAGIAASSADALSPEAFAAASGQTVTAARRALRRRHALLFPALGARAESVLRAGGLSAASGGTWTSVLHGSDKGRAVARYISAWQAAHGAVRAAAVGDAPNDASMLEAVDLSFAMPGPGGDAAPALRAIPGVHVLRAADTSGWRQLLALLRGAPRDA